MSWSTHSELFNSFQTHYTKPKPYKKEYDDSLSRNGLKPIRTFGRDISNLPTSSVLANERLKKPSKIDYSKNAGKIGWALLGKPNDHQQSLRIIHDFENGNVTSNGSNRQQPLDTKLMNMRKKSAARAGVSVKRYISSSSLTDRNKKFKVVRQGPPKSKHQLYKHKIPILKENRGSGSVFSHTNDKQPVKLSIQKCNIRSSIGGIKPINKSMKTRSKSRSQLGTGNNSKSIANVTVATQLPNLHNMSTASLLSNCQLDKQSIGELKKSNYGSQKKLNFKIASKTPSNLVIERSSIVSKQNERLTSEEKIKQFHDWRNRCSNELEVPRNMHRTKMRFNSSVDHSYMDTKKTKPDLLSVPEYADDIYKNEQKRYSFWMPKPDYMSTQNDINQKMRRILVDWLIKVHLKFKLLPETLYLTINIIDRYLSLEVVSRKLLQLVGVTAMHIAWKYEEIYPPEASDFVYITDNAYSKTDLLETEFKILKTLEFQLTFISCFRYLERLSSQTNCENIFKGAKKLLDLTLVDYNMLKYEPNITAASSLYLAHVINRK